MVDSLFDHEPFHDEKVKLIRKDQLGIKIESGNRSGRQGYADSIMLGDLHAERHLTSFRVGCEAREPASTGFKAQPVSGANVLVFSISIQKNGPPLRTADESSSADFHGGWTSDRNRCMSDLQAALTNIVSGPIGVTRQIPRLFERAATG